MTFLKTIIMGIVHGITEFFPISNSAHMVFLKSCFQENDVGIILDILLHLGTVLAVTIVYFRDIKKLTLEFFFMIGDFNVNLMTFFQNLFQKQEKEYRRIITSSYRKFVILLIISVIPAGIVSYISKNLVEYFVNFLFIPGIGLLVTSIILFFTDYLDNGEKTPKHVTYVNAFMIGICQGISVFPGISRIGICISACLLSKFDRKFAVKYSFLMSIPTMLGALIIKLKYIEIKDFALPEILYYILGAFIAAVVGYICIKMLLVIVKHKKLKYFATYCFLAGFLAIGGYIYMK
ncbi:undecaprenyl-diphosphate phosphatase [Anaerosacchariphilus polymeriproducens]|uniref:Undecaprenyl-diphosphatase n=1 Tax=Anaerosacchariphilus polymeriproducens TaxID=1812858 RepID=A0A371AU41_9FIRM|nr:undecaprenyl-diphosphate phosphatase [Anaerosacchariphilus polymeriproducens]RDU23086.1 undecaprenyl-diphosphate phosphatase [Anaerosacchariphilus polymeriproducens]